MAKIIGVIMIVLLVIWLLPLFALIFVSLFGFLVEYWWLILLWIFAIGAFLHYKLNKKQTK